MIRMDCFLTTNYKQGYIFSKHVDNIEVIQVRVDATAYMIYVKSYHAAKILITKHAKKYGGK